MGTQHRLIVFDRPLAGAHIPGHPVREYSAADLAAARAAAYREGYDAARAFADSQLVEFRNEVHQLQDGLLKNLPHMDTAMIDQLRIGLPALAVDIARRLLADFEPPGDLVAKLCIEALEQLFPERENLELVVCARDADLLLKHMPDLASRYPGLKIRSDVTLMPGDCQVRSRFGLTDARLSAKLETIQNELVRAS